MFRKKLKTDVTIDKFKARLVVLGCGQEEGVNYFNTYAPMARVTTIRVLFSITAIYKMVIHQVDVKITFLNGDLEEEIYMTQPEGYMVPKQDNKACKLVKSLYRLRQALKQWHEKFDNTLISNGYTVNESEMCVYSKLSKESRVIICLYIDDMLIFETNLKVVKNTKKFLFFKFDMKDLGEADVILGIKILRTPRELMLNQSHYMKKILEKFGHSNCSPVSTSYDSSIHLKKNISNLVAQIDYVRVIGSLNYLLNCIRLDIACTVGKLNRYTHNPDQTH